MPNKTIARNHHNKAARAFTQARANGVTVYSLENEFRGECLGEGRENFDEGQWLETKWREFRGARLTVDERGNYRMRLHSNCWYEWKGAAPASAPALAEPTTEAIEAYQAKRQAKADRLRERAEKAEVKSAAGFERARAIGDAIPMGQPILIGHHSEKRHRRALDRIDRGMRQGVEEEKKAARLRERARGVENDPDIRAEDPEAVRKLRDKIAELTARREQMKAVNKIVRDKKLDRDSKVERLCELFDGNGAMAEEMLKPDCMGVIGFASYSLSNIGARIRDAEKRLAGLIASAELGNLDDESGEGWTISFDAVDHRVRITLDTRLSKEDFQKFRRAGFVWSRANQAFQRQLNTSGVSAARRVIREVFASS